MTSRVSGMSMRMDRSIKAGRVNRNRVSRQRNTFSKFPLKNWATMASTTSTRSTT